MSGAEFLLNGDLGELGRLAARVADFCAGNSLDDEAEFQLNLVLEELFVNALRHGGCAGAANCVRVRLRRGTEGVEVEFRDRGRPFDPSAAPRADLQGTLEERGDGGLGLHLVREIMGDFDYRRDGEWNQITMTRHKN
jgi:serine/threonine-protein kinase RsbW